MIKSIWLLAAMLIFVNLNSAYAHEKEPPCNDESLQEARDRDAKEHKDHEHEHGNHHDH